MQKDKYVSKYGWKYKPANQATAGDIVVRSGHMEIYAGDGYFLNCRFY